MKINLYPLFLIVFATLLISSCRKDGSKPRGGSIVGSWQEVKLTLHQYNSATTSHDTIFSSVSFSAGDYFSFNADGSAVRSQTGVYNYGGKVQTLDGGTYLTILNRYIYTVTDTTLNLTSTDRYPTANVESLSDIEQLDATHLVLQQKTYFYTSFPGPSLNYDPTLITTTYFIKK